MDAISYTVAHTNLAKTMEQVCNDPCVWHYYSKERSSRSDHFLEDYQAMEETTYLLRSPANARHLLESIAELETGKGTAQKLIE